MQTICEQHTKLVMKVVVDNCNSVARSYLFYEMC